MQTDKYLTFGALLVLISFTAYCSAIECYHCNSYVSGQCAENYETFLVDCDSLGDHNYTFCRKTVQTASTKEPEKTTLRIFRSCGWAEEPKLSPANDEDPADLRCYRRTGTYGVEMLYCACHADGCNGASVNGISVIMLGFVALFAFMWQK